MWWSWILVALGGERLEVGRAMVASDHRLASAAGAEVLAAGGNAVDAAVATALAAGVVQPSGSGLGGGGFAVVVHPDGTRFTLDFREVAPAAAARDMFVDASGKGDVHRSQVGGLAVAVPGEAAGLAWLLARHGSLPPEAVVAPAVRLARDGFEVGAHLEHALAQSRHAEVTTWYAVSGGRLVNPPLADTLMRWASTKGSSLRDGPDARHLAAEVAEIGGILTNVDVERYTPKVRDPLEIRYEGRTVVTMGPPSSGGIGLGQLLRVLDGTDLASLGHNSPAYVHRLTEAMKHAYADRAHHLGDPDFAQVDTARLLSDARIAEIRGAFDPAHTLPMERYGARIGHPADGGTQHISVLDAAGMAVALTTTVNTSFGSGVVVEELGIVLNNEMDDFSVQPGVANAYGLVGTEENAVAPGKRPLSSMTPTIVLDGSGRPVLVVGASGGAQIISATAQVLLDVLEFGMDAQTAVSEPRFHHQWMPETLWLEEGFSAADRAAAEQKGHVLHVAAPHYSSVQVVRVRPDGVVEGGADPRKGGWPAGVP